MRHVVVTCCRELVSTRLACVCMYVCMCVCRYVYVCVYVCMHVCMYVLCMYVHRCAQNFSLEAGDVDPEAIYI